MRKCDLETALKFTSTDLTRPSLIGVRVEPGRLIACDGHRLIIIHESDERKPAAEGETATITNESAARIIKKTIKGEEITIDPLSGSATVGGTPIETQRVKNPFPQYLQVMPKVGRDGEILVRLDPYNLKSIVEAAIKTHVNGGAPWIEFAISDPLSPVRFEGDRIEGCVMPQRR